MQCSGVFLLTTHFGNRERASATTCAKFKTIVAVSTIKVVIMAVARYETELICLAVACAELWVDS